MLIKQERLAATQKKARSIRAATSSPANREQRSFSDAEASVSEKLPIQMAAINGIAALKRDTCAEDKNSRRTNSVLSPIIYFSCQPSQATDHRKCCIIQYFSEMSKEQENSYANCIQTVSICPQTRGTSSRAEYGWMKIVFLNLPKFAEIARTLLPSR